MKAWGNQMKDLGEVLVFNLSNLKPEPYWKEDKQKNDVNFTRARAQRGWLVELKEERKTE